MRFDLLGRDEMPIGDDIETRGRAAFDHVPGAYVRMLPFLIFQRRDRETGRYDRSETAIVPHPDEVGSNVAENLGDRLQSVRPFRRIGGCAIDGFDRCDEFVSPRPVSPHSVHPAGFVRNVTKQ